MTKSPVAELRTWMVRAAIGSLALSSLAACVTSEPLRKEAMEITREVAKGPAEAPFRSVTNFSSAVRCMDEMFSDFGIRDLAIQIEDIADQTKKVSVGTKDMLLTTLSAMTRRSRAIRFVSFGEGTRNSVVMKEQAGDKRAYQNLPQFGIQGSISQFDDNVAKAAKDAGFGLGEWLTIGKSASATSKIVALDLTVFNQSDFSAVPGVFSRNAVAIFGQGDGIDGEARYKKLGVNYATTLSRSEGTAIAVRNLVELASVELLGKLTRVPYWKCLGASPDEPDVRAEVDDWFESMSASTSELFAWFQYQLYVRGAFSGKVDGVPTPAFASALRDYKVAMGRKADTDLNAEFLHAYLHADHVAAMQRIQKKPVSEKTLPRQSSRIDASLTIRGGERAIGFGERVELEVRTSASGHAHCYLQDDAGRVSRIHPNRFARATLVSATQSIVVPSGGKVKYHASKNGVPEVIECFVADRDLLTSVSAKYASLDLEPLPGVMSLDEVRSEFERVGGPALGTARYVIKPIKAR